MDTDTKQNKIWYLEAEVKRLKAQILFLEEQLDIKTQGLPDPFDDYDDDPYY